MKDLVDDFNYPDEYLSDDYLRQDADDRELISRQEINVKLKQVRHYGD